MKLNKFVKYRSSQKYITAGFLYIAIICSCVKNQFPTGGFEVNFD